MRPVTRLPSIERFLNVNPQSISRVFFYQLIVAMSLENNFAAMSLLILNMRIPLWPSHALL